MTDQPKIDEAAATPTENVPVVASAPLPPKVQLVASAEVMAIIPRTLDEAWRYAEMLWKSGTAPDSYDNDPKKIIIGVLASMELGVPPMTGIRGIAIINGRPAVWGDLAQALVQSRNLITDFEKVYTGPEFEDPWNCHVHIGRRGQSKPYEGDFSVADAKRAHLWLNPKKKPWIEYPKRMLFNRARAFALRDGFADCLAGLAIAEEAQDLPPPPAEVTTDFLNDDVPAKQIEAQPAAESANAP